MVILVGLKERLDFSARLKSRIGSDQVHFAPFTANELKTILDYKLDGTTDTVFDSDALNVQLLRFTQRHGDIRRSFRVLRDLIGLLPSPRGNRRVSLETIKQADTNSMTRAMMVLQQLARNQ